MIYMYLYSLCQHVPTWQVLQLHVPLISSLKKKLDVNKTK